MYEKENLQETIRYCRAHNRILRDLDAEEITRRIWSIVEETVGGLFEEDLVKFGSQMMPVFNAWFVIDRTPDGLQVPLEERGERVSHMINFFVRLGRRPAISVA